MQLDAVGKRYGLRQPWVFQDVRANVAAGRLVRVEGSNGSGKSTLLRVVAGVLLPSAGKVIARPRVGYVPERFPPAMSFSGRDYLLRLGQAHGLRGGALKSRVEECLTRFEAIEYASVPLRHLSKGMCQKMAVVQALVADPGLLVLDEAWTGLDQIARDTLDAIVAERIAAGSRVVFVDHDRRRLAGLVSERWLMANGHVTIAGGADPGITSEGRRQRPGVLIELADAQDLAAALGEVAGVRSVTEEHGHLMVQTDAADSDGVLRQALAAGAHVAAVYQESEGQS